VLLEHAEKLEGIAFGIEEQALPVVKSDAKSRAAACREFFPTANPASARIFVVDTVSTGGEGIDLLLQALDLLPSPDFCVALLGPVGEKSLEALNIAMRRHAGRFVHLPEVDGALFARILSAGNFILVPGALEPGRVFAAASMRNGLIPVMEFCPGLPDLVKDFDPVTGSGNGLVFYRHSLNALADAVKRALFLPKGESEILSQRARETDFSWTPALARLEELQHRLSRKAGRASA
jgi:starch synthase